MIYTTKHTKGLIIFKLLRDLRGDNKFMTDKSNWGDGTAFSVEPLG